MKRYDVVIVGAGPAGSTVAKHIAENSDVSVLLIDKHAEIGVPKRCGEGLSARVFREFGLPLEKRFINRAMYGAAIYAPNGDALKVRYDEPNGYVIERKIFDKFLAYYASKAGAEVKACYYANIWKENGKIKGVEAEGIDGKEKIEAKIIVAADGVESQIARQADIDTRIPLSEIDSCFEYEMSNLKIEESDLIHIYLGNEIAKRGYVWIFPKDEDRANVGVGIAGDCEKTAKYYLDKFIRKHKKIFSKASILEVNVGCVPVGGFLKTLVKDNVVVVGDAARQVNPIHGGGIYEAMYAGRLAGLAIVKALENNNVSLLKEYEKRWWAERGRKLRNVLKVRKFAENLSDEEMNFLAKIWSAEDLIELGRGNLSAFKILIKKAIRYPRLISLAKRFLV